MRRGEKIVLIKSRGTRERRTRVDPEAVQKSPMIHSISAIDRDEVVRGDLEFEPRMPRQRWPKNHRG